MMSPAWRRLVGVTVRVNCWSWLSWEGAAPPFSLMERAIEETELGAVLVLGVSEPDVMA